ncbi:hypothetical protein IMSAG049_01524 [Clostridiales bacterium]|nr:hypothetical protein IMSAG049_01524 [Clostridiales bacterium]
MVSMAMKFTYIDIAVLLLISILAVVNAKKGLAGALLRFMPTAAGVILSWKLSGKLIKYLRGTFLFPLISKKINSTVALENVLPDIALNTQNEIISTMQVPEVIKNALVSNNNSVVYKIFGADTLQDYIAGFLTNVLISVGAVAVLYIAGYLAGKIVLKTLDMANDAPIIGLFSKAGGFVVGIMKGVCIAWIAGIAITFFCCEPWAQDFIWTLERSVAAGWLYRNNILLYVVLSIIA